MADTFTSALKLRKPEVGANNNTWGTLLNEDALDLIDAAVGGYKAIALSNSNVTLTDTDGEDNQTRAQHINFSGTLTDNVIVTIPANNSNRKGYIVRNGTSGAFTITITAGTGADGSVVLPSPGDGFPFFIHKTSDNGVQAVRVLKGAMTNEAQTWTAAQIPSRVTLTDAASIAVNMALGNSFIVTLGGNRTLANPTNVNQGQYFDVLVVQDGTGGRTLSYGSNYRAPSGAFPTVTATAGRLSLLSFYAYSATRILLIGATLDFNPT